MAVKCRIIECKESFQDWDKFVCAIGMPELMNITEGQMENLYEGDNHFRKFKNRRTNSTYIALSRPKPGSKIQAIERNKKTRRPRLISKLFGIL